jgi:argininosuccinate synthase
MSDKRKIVLGFSGGLDTSYCVKYLTEEKGYEVHSIIVNTGGFSDEELQQIEKHAYTLGVTSHVTVNAVKNYYDRIIKYLVFGNVLKNNTYPLSVSAERLVQALHIGCARKHRCRKRSGSFRYGFSYHDTGC